MANDPAHTDEDTAETLQTEASDSEPDSLVSDIEESLTDDGFDVFHGKEFISLRGSGELGPNTTVTERYLKGAEAVMLAYNEGANEIVIIPLPRDYDKPNVYGIHDGDQLTIAARTFLKSYGILPETTVRYTPEYDKTIGPAAVDGGLRIDLDQEAKEVTVSQDDNGADK